MTAASRNDVTEMAPLVNELHAVAGKVGHSRRLARRLGLRFGATPPGAAADGIESVPPEEGIDDDSGPGEARWTVERTLAWLHQNRRLRIRYERGPDIPQAFRTLGRIEICAGALPVGVC